MKPRFEKGQVSRRLVGMEDPPRDLSSTTHRFVVCADTQYGMLTDNKDWDTEIEYSRKAIDCMNQMHPLPSFCCVCGDLTDMDRSFEAKKAETEFSMEECDKIQLQQRKDFKKVWSDLDERIALVCLCGNHDVGNRPTKRSLELYRKEFGDDYLSFWSSPNVYNIVLNTTLISDPSADEATEEMAKGQLDWLEERLKEVRSLPPTNNEVIIFVFAHHPWFLYDENEEADTMDGFCEWHGNKLPDSYFIIPLERRRVILDLFRKYKVAASFSGHFHQNLVSETSFGMKMIITGPLSATLESSGKEKMKRRKSGHQLRLDEPNTLGLRVVDVLEDGSFRHEFVPIDTHHSKNDNNKK